jgi:hypothetical protein
VLKHEDYGGNRELRTKGRDQGWVDVGGTDVLKSTGNRPQELDGIFAFDTAMATVKPGGKGEDNHDESVP